MTPVITCDSVLGRGRSHGSAVEAEENKVADEKAEPWKERMEEKLLLQSIHNSVFISWRHSED